MRNYQGSCSGLRYAAGQDSIDLVGQNPPGAPRGKDRSKLTPGRVNLEDSTPTGMIVQDRAELSGFLADKLVATALYSEFEPLTPCRVNPESRGSRADRHDHAGAQRIIRVLRRGAGRGCVLRRSRRAGVEVV